MKPRYLPYFYLACLLGMSFIQMPASSQKFSKNSKSRQTTRHLSSPASRTNPVPAATLPQENAQSVASYTKLAAHPSTPMHHIASLNLESASSGTLCQNIGQFYRNADKKTRCWYTTCCLCCSVKLAFSYCGIGNCNEFKPPPLDAQMNFIEIDAHGEDKSVQL